MQVGKHFLRWVHHWGAFTHPWPTGLGDRQFPRIPLSGSA